MLVVVGVSLWMGRCRSVSVGRFLWVGYCESVAVVQSLLAGRYGRSLWVTCFVSVATLLVILCHALWVGRCVGRFLWFGCCGLVAVL